MGKTDHDNLRLLGIKTTLPKSPKEAILEKVDNPHLTSNYLIRFSCPEFTTLCPVTGQPDFAYLIIDYIPDAFIIESKSLKLFLSSFRNQQGFSEEVTVNIAKRLEEEVDPRWLRIGGYWYPRGGIPIDVFYQRGKIPEGSWVPDQKIEPYRGSR
ncbi:MAG TPA: NADPH-dependent 7-cyano-7-deazaguanine reductase QueF [Rhodospirillales bacterium]|jgi:7-cyano-7-deazaguanine reductase|nr:MAG: NADPH-dependent 7-cyano-7-deazaguanine reductase [Alphaproteobacteria bacterium MarineAlpha3_Bin6]HIA82505.1 NADPH-dependent 7-cyano-7-deazaguanine reductase QueF [Rhodospirillales bacterium]HIB20332.1 NADPH-dependent 7-cyano-7-deazaguanine reductase QueF [Rhodospirillales bacterium]HIC61022.1 NADPH-dependent 7-cyano-7-deazaguanine reductase QueF [Rhodospirillales bacterium]HIN75014.1 NADPH-dependent 7-cyano-7-deazaguanine reductase QueF [Rhodospirillales bacterium]|tara:strand:- start:74 stop:538 length:465 start_codon:yes stop_codon:yes gene_type:complete